MSNTLAAGFLKEMEAEAPASRKCLERIPDSLFGWKPHEKSMTMGYLSLLVAEVPRWIAMMVEDPEIDFATFRHFDPKTTADLVKHLDENLSAAREALKRTADEALSGTFALKSNGRILMSLPRKGIIGPTLNHWVHHRGQLTVFMRLKDIPVPAIYGPSADERGF